jgi:hypothetical protein
MSPATVIPVRGVELTDENLIPDARRVELTESIYKGLKYIASVFEAIEKLPVPNAKRISLRIGLELELTQYGKVIPLNSLHNSEKVEIHKEAGPAQIELVTTRPNVVTDILNIVYTDLVQKIRDSKLELGSGVKPLSQFGFNILPDLNNPRFRQFVANAGKITSRINESITPIKERSIAFIVKVTGNSLSFPGFLLRTTEEDRKLNPMPEIFTHSTQVGPCLSQEEQGIIDLAALTNASIVLGSLHGAACANSVLERGSDEKIQSSRILLLATLVGKNAFSSCPTFGTMSERFKAIANNLNDGKISPIFDPEQGGGKSSIPEELEDNKVASDIQNALNAMGSLWDLNQRTKGVDTALFVKILEEIADGKDISETASKILDKLYLEYRPLDTQPTLIENIGMSAITSLSILGLATLLKENKVYIDNQPATTDNLNELFSLESRKQDYVSVGIFGLNGGIPRISKVVTEGENVINISSTKASASESLLALKYLFEYGCEVDGVTVQDNNYLTRILDQRINGVRLDSGELLRTPADVATFIFDCVAKNTPLPPFVQEDSPLPPPVRQVVDLAVVDVLHRMFMETLDSKQTCLDWIIDKQDEIRKWTIQ